MKAAAAQLDVSLTHYNLMSQILMYLTQSDAGALCDWIDAEPRVAWIARDRREGATYWWRAVERLGTLTPGEHCLWHLDSGALNVPSRLQAVPDQIVSDPFAGWQQDFGWEEERREHWTPWFGGNLPGPVNLSFVPDGGEAPGSIGRSDFSWLGDRYRSIGKPAAEDARRWWRRLHRYVKTAATELPWPPESNSRRHRAYAFPEAYAQFKRGRTLDVNPSWPRTEPTVDRARGAG